MQTKCKSRRFLQVLLERFVQQIQSDKLLLFRDCLFRLIHVRHDGPTRPLPNLVLFYDDLWRRSDALPCVLHKLLDIPLERVQDGCATDRSK